MQNKPMKDAGEGPAAERRVASDPATVAELLADRSIVIVGMMGAGKSSVGRRLASRLSIPFTDADHEIEVAAGQSIPEIFENYGEAHFRDGEKRVIERLLRSGPQVLATGGGAWMDADTRARVGETGVSVWIKADIDLLMRRVRRRSNRPLLQNDDPEGTMRALMEKRYPVYALADITVVSQDAPHETVVGEICEELAGFLSSRQGGNG
ncbi:MAG: shikimate kinase [Flavobacteriaceae bacterium]